MDCVRASSSIMQVMNTMSPQPMSNDWARKWAHGPHATFVRMGWGAHERAPFDSVAGATSLRTSSVLLRRMEVGW